MTTSIAKTKATAAAPGITQAELSELFALHRRVEEMCCAFRLRMLAGATVEPGRYAVEPEWGEPSPVAGFDVDHAFFEDKEPPLTDPPIFAALQAALEASK